MSGFTEHKMLSVIHGI